MAKRTRDPARSEKILDAAAGLLADSGYHAVSMAEIGERAGITGSAIYRHFESKASILVVLFDRVIDDLLAQGRSAVEGNPDLRAALDELIAGQVRFVVGERHLAQVYHNEISNLPREDQVRLRRKQRLYLEEWVHVYGELAGLEEPMTRTRVHIAIGAIQAVLFHQVTLAPDVLSDTLTQAACAVLALDRRH
ncbi:TetR/AcrR family transcriptional regulator [Nocardioides sp. LHG3406-4]|uniref:TetR/AcrR family transcriptional regulator n=1 Tax=Nocardioides sp. LHG3406-4 TaxID=2804575 RepID=UPI003CEE8A82